MPFKPMKLKAYLAWISRYGWEIRKAGSGDYSLYSETGTRVVLFIKVTHPGNDVAALSVRATRAALKAKGKE